MLSVRQKADAVATYRQVSVFLMETLARWVPTAPELEVKALFGRHLWEMAQHADAFGHRTAELRGSMHQNRAPVQDYQRALAELEAAPDSAQRMAMFHDGILVDLARRYAAYLLDTDELMDEPTVRILERATTDIARMRRERDALLAERPDLSGASDAAARLLRRTSAIGDIVDYRPDPAAAGVT
jgi:hypothetical protein